VDIQGSPRVLPQQNAKLGETGIWWSIPIGWIFGAIAAILYYKHGRWQKKSVVNSTLIEGEESIC
jgi:Na+-driven multidrug efflux pump